MERRTVRGTDAAQCAELHRAVHETDVARWGTGAAGRREHHEACTGRDGGPINR